MSRFFVVRARVLFAAIFIPILAQLSFGQVTLREALDFDGDQKADFSIFRPSENAWYILGSTGNFMFQTWGLATEDRLVPGDWDGDNKGDYAVWRDSEGIWYILNSSTSTFTGFPWGASGDEPIARDYDGDGKTDAAIARRFNGVIEWWVQKSTGGISFNQWGVASDFVAPGDYDGDGKFDLCVQRGTPTGAEFYILGSQNGFFGFVWGLGTDYVVPGDYDGDGKTDIAVVREGTLSTDPLTWYVLRSDGQGFIGMEFGVTGDDYNTQGDYDGDGKTDIAVWRDSSGFFFIWNSSTQSLTGGPWGGPGDLPVAAYDTH